MPSQIPESIHTIVYDFGGVVTAPLITGILSLSQRIDREVESIVASMSAPIERGSLGPLAALEAGDLTETEAVSIFCKRLELTPRDLHGDETFGEVWLRTLGIDQATLTQAQALKRAGYRTGLATNNVNEWRSIWLGLIDPHLFDFIVDSSEVRLRKPTMEFYLELARRVNGTQGVLVLDDEPVNIQTADRAGFGTLLWGPDSTRSRRDLERLLP